MRIYLLLKTAVTLALFSFFFTSVPHVWAQSSGREFWIAIPPNEFDGAYPTVDLEISVTSAFDTWVMLEHPGSGFTATKQVVAGQVTRFSTSDQSAYWAWEVRDDEKPSNQGIRITSGEPVQVSVLNYKSVSSDGYMAIPVDSWGTNYIHLGFYDFGEFSSSSPWGGGFVIVARDNNTQVSILLKGVDSGNPIARTKRNKSLGNAYNVSLQRGQTYMVRGNGQTLNEFDISGTQIISSKPIGLFSFHQRTMIPSFPSPNNGRNHLVEMLPPVNTWGTEHVTLELNRAGNRGDFFRIIAASPDTKFSCKYTDLQDGQTYTWEGTLAAAGDFMEKENTWPPVASIRGAAVWTSDKPTLVMQYSYSGAWSNSSDWDPFMVQVVPTAKYATTGRFSTPGSSNFTDNFLTVIAIGDPNDPQQALLKTMKFNDTPIWELFPSFLTNRIQNTSYYWARINAPSGASSLAGDTRFSAMLYGTSSFAGYGWPVATAESMASTDVREASTGPQLLLATEPNPLSEKIRIRYTLPASGDVRLELYTTAGDKVRVFATGHADAGVHTLEAPVDDLASGVYMCRLECSGQSATQQIHIVK